MDEDRVTLPAVAKLLGKSERTLQLWFRPHRAESSRDGYPISTVVAVLSQHRVTVTAEALASITPHRDEPSPQLRQDAPKTAELAAQLVAMAKTVEQLVEDGRRREQELIEAREAGAMYQERARGLQEETARLRAQLALPPPQGPSDSMAKPPRWQFWRRGQ